MKKTLFLRFCLLALAAALPSMAALADPTDAQACTDLKLWAITDSTITAVTYTPVGTGVAEPFCEIRLSQTPTPSSIILSVVRLPSKANWNGQLLGYGNGGFAGGSYGAPAVASAGSGKFFAVATTNMGTGNTESDVIGNFDRIADWGYRSTHEMTVAAKELIGIYYGAPPSRSYFNGTSTGGQQGLIEAQRYPDDYDGILSGAPVTNRTRLHANFNWSFAAFNLDVSARLSDAQVNALHDAVLASCDELDGVKDGVIRDARACHFEPATLLCKAGDSPDACLTDKQLAAVEKVYGGMVNPRTGELLAHGWPRGSELDWESMFLGGSPSYSSIHRWVFGSAWQWQNYNYDTDVAYEDATLGGLVNAIDPDLSAFKARGGKLLNFHGWADPTVNPYDTVSYYEKVDATVAGGAHSFHRLFLVPGKNHSQVGPGPNEPDFFGALRAWVENGEAPDMLMASSGGVSRPLCAYPNLAQYKGSGSFDDGTNYECVKADESGLAVADATTPPASGNGGAAGSSGNGAGAAPGAPGFAVGNDDGGGGCTVARLGAPLDPTLVLLAVFALVVLGLRHRLRAARNSPRDVG
jgi:feruloyl esterase